VWLLENMGLFKNNFININILNYNKYASHIFDKQDILNISL